MPESLAWLGAGIVLGAALALSAVRWATWYEQRYLFQQARQRVSRDG